MITASMLFSGEIKSEGENTCYYCGAICSDEYLSEDYVKDTFTNRDIVKAPASQYVCKGCVLAMGQGDDLMQMIDGTVKERTNDRGMQPRMYSWVLTSGKRIAATKAHMKQIRDVLMSPPDPPFAIVLTDSGQKQLIFRAPVALSKNVYPVLLEDEEIIVDKNRLEYLQTLTLPIVAALGKPALLGEIGIASYVRYDEYHGNTDALEEWVSIRDQPICRLAAWISKSKEEAQNECRPVVSGRVSEKDCRDGRSQEDDAGNGVGCSEGRGGQFLFDIGEPVRR